MFEDRLQAIESDIGAERAYAMALRQLELNEERKRQSGPGGLLHFIRYFWHLVEPTKKFVEGWALEAMCKHLEAVDEGRIQKLLVTVPPGSAKSLLCSVFYPLWQWGPRNKAEQRFLNFAYAAHLPQRDNGRMLQILQTKEWRELWGKRRYRDADGTLMFAGFELTAEGKEKIGTSKTGWKYASSVGGVGTGERADCVLCLPANQRILTDKGWLPIGEIVDRRIGVLVASVDHENAHVEWQPIEAYERNPGREIYKIRFDDGEVRCTAEHPVFVSGKGYVRADLLRKGDKLVWAGRPIDLSELSVPDPSQAEPSPEILQQGLPLRASEKTGSRSEQQAMPSVRRGRLQTAGSPCAQSFDILQPCMPWEVERQREQSDVHRNIRDLLRALRQDIRKTEYGAQTLLPRMRQKGQKTADAIGMECRTAMPSMFNPLHGDSAKADLLHSKMRRYSPLLSGSGEEQWALGAWGGRAPIPSRMDEDFQGVHSEAGCPMLPILCEKERSGKKSGCASHRLQQEQSGSDQSDNALQVVSRANARGRRVACDLEIRVVRDIEIESSPDLVFNIRIAKNHNYFAEGILFHNCDDPHSIKDDTSEVVRPETVRWFKEAMSNRLNDMERSAIIVIMQRSHEADVAGTIIDDDMGYVHLNIPMEYEADQHCTTYTDDGKFFWTDPRSVEGECFWPERFPPKAVADIKKLGAHTVIAQYQQRPEPRGGAIIKRAYWRNYEVPDKGPRKGKWPEFEYVVVSIDSAFTEKTENDPTGCSVWGVWQNPEGSMCVMLLNAWRKWLTLNGTARRKLKTESWGDYRAETEETWGLVQWTRYECSRHKADALLIENKANGIDLQNEVIRLSQHDPWSIVMIDPKNLDKIARLRRIESVFAEGLVYAILEKAYAKLAIDEMAAAPRGRFRDITDSASQAINYLRKCGYLEHVDVFKERQVREQERRGKKPRGQAPLYPA